MNIFEALRESHEIQRDLSEKLLQTSGDSPERHELFKQLKNELFAHETAEDRYFYIPLMMTDSGLSITRHALAEHHEMDEMIEELSETDFSNPGWIAIAKKLSDKVHHHLKEGRAQLFSAGRKKFWERIRKQL